jgi:hypothetical protein
MFFDRAIALAHVFGEVHAVAEEIFQAVTRAAAIASGRNEILIS